MSLNFDKYKKNKDLKAQLVNENLKAQFIVLNSPLPGFVKPSEKFLDNEPQLGTYTATSKHGSKSR